MEDLSRLAGCHRRIPEQLLHRARELRQQQPPAEQTMVMLARASLDAKVPRPAGEGFRVRANASANTFSHCL